MAAVARELLETAVEMAQRAGVSSRSEFQRGDLAEPIAKVAITADRDLVVMGTRHLSGDKRLMTGRIYNAEIATARCPVLVVPCVQVGALVRWARAW